MNAHPDSTPLAAVAAPRWLGYLGLGLVLFLFLLGFLLPRRAALPSAEGPPAPRLELSSLALAPAAGPRGIGQSIAHGASARLELAPAGAGGLAVFELPGFGRSGELARLRHLGPLEAGPVSIPLTAPESGESLCLVLVLTGEVPDERRARSLLAQVRPSGPWLAPVLLRELRSEPRLGAASETIARAYGLSAPLRPPD